MTTLSTSSIITQAALGSPAGIQAWTGELFGALIACGLTQTNDTGQLTITGSGGTATTNATQPVATGPQALFMCFTFNDTPAAGTLATTALNSGGTGYDAGGTHTYTVITATGATSGATCTCTVTVTGGVCGNMGTLGTVGNFIVGEKITIPNSSLGGSGSGASWTAASLSTGSPVIFRIDVGGSATAVTDPTIWVTLGQGTNGAGTIAGAAGTTKMTQVQCGSGAAPVSTSAVYTSYYCYNSTLGTCLVAMKFGATAGCYSMGFYIHRSNDSTGAPTGTSVSLYSGSANTSNPSTNYLAGCQQTLNYANSLVYPTIGTTASTQWGCIPQNPNGSVIFGLTATLESSTVFIFNTIVVNPAFFYSAFMGVALLTDVANGTSVSTTIVGAQAVTLISLQSMFGVAAAPFQTAGLSIMAVYL